MTKSRFLITVTYLALLSFVAVLMPAPVATAQTVSGTESQEAKTTDSPSLASSPLPQDAAQTAAADQAAPTAVAPLTPAELPVTEPASAAEAPTIAPDQQPAIIQDAQIPPANQVAPATAQASLAPPATVAPQIAPTVAPVEAEAQTDSPVVVKIRNNLRDFAFTKLISMSSKLCFTSTKHCIEQRDGKWVASYKDISPDTLIVQVKTMEGNSNKYVGLIKYAVLQYEATADTKQLLAQQEFQMTKRLWQTEILRFDGKTWK